MRSTWWRVFAMVGALTVAGESDALACSCAMAGPPCQAAWTADVVFSGVVLSTTSIDHDSLGEPYQSKLVKFSADRGYVNAAPGPIEVLTGTGGGDCSYSFKVGAHYLVYAWRQSAGLYTGRCSRTRPVADAREDLQYLTTMGASGSGGRVFGRINEWRRDPAEERGVDFGPVEGLMVSVRGAAFARDVITDADGRYQMAGLPLGKATITIVPPFGYQPSPFEHAIEIKDLRACSQVDRTFEQIARVSGRVVDAAGRPLGGVEVEAVAAELAGFSPPPYQRPVKTDDVGAFEFRDLPPGVYVFGINVTKNPFSRQAGSAVFLPGTAVASEAAVVELKAGDKKEVGALRLSGR